MSNNGVLQSKNSKYLPASTTTYNVSCDDDFIFVDTSVNAVTLVLPNIRNANILENPKCFKINDYSGNAGTNNITIIGCGGDSVNSGASVILSNNYGSAEVNVVNQDEWFVVRDVSANLSGYVPYVGATKNVNLGTYGITSGFSYVNGGEVRITAPIGDSFAVYNALSVKQVFIDYTNQLGFNCGGSVAYFGTFGNPTAGLVGFSTVGQVIQAYDIATVRSGIGGGSVYFATTSPKALLELRGKANEVQFIIQSYSTQTNSVYEIRDAFENPYIQLSGSWNYSIGTATFGLNNIYLYSNNSISLSATNISFSTSQYVVFNNLGGGTIVSGFRLSDKYITLDDVSGFIQLKDGIANSAYFTVDNKNVSLYAGASGTTATTFKGIQYIADYSANYTNRSLVDKAYVTSVLSSGYVPYTGASSNVNLGNYSLTTNQITLSGNISSTAWTTNGIRIKGVASTFTDTSSSGTVADAYTNVLVGNTIAASNVTTFTNYYSTYISSSTAGSNVTFTNNWALGTDSSINVVNGGYAIANGLVVNTSSSYVQIGANSAWVGARIYAQGTIRFQIDGAATSGALPYLTCSPNSNTNQTASTEINGYLYNSYSRQWATGNITTQRERLYRTVTYNFVGASTITNAYGAYFEAPAAGANATITNNWALGVNHNVLISGSTNQNMYKVASTVTSATNTFQAENDLGNNIGMSVFGSTFGVSALKNNGYLATKKDLYIGTNGDVASGGTNSVYIMTGGYAPSTQTRLTIDSNGSASFTAGATTTGATTSFLINTPAHTGQTASANIPNFKVTGSTKTWAAGTLAAQYFNYFAANTVAFASASTATNVYGLYVEAATAGSNATITNNWGIGFTGGLFKNSTGNTVLSSAALSTSATDGFVYIPTSAGAPTGVPTSFTGTVAMQYDTTNNKLYIYNGGWKSVTLA